MYRRTKQRCHSSNRKISLMIILCYSVLLCRGGYAAPSYRLYREGYSSTAKVLLIVVDENIGNPRKNTRLAMYNEESGSVKRVVIPGNAFPADFAWAPGRDAFVVTHIEGLTFFQKDVSNHEYKAKAIRYPSDTYSMDCSWSPNGEWLAVYLSDLKSIKNHWLGLYKFNDKKLVRTNIGIDKSHIFWGDDGLLYATNNNNVLTIELSAGEPKVIQSVPYKGGRVLFYGMFGEQPLFQAYDEIRLDDKTLVKLDQPNMFRFIATETVLFVSASPGQLAAFDPSGYEISRIDPGRLINFGSVKDPNTVYALADSNLVRVCIEKESLSIDTTCNLNDATKNSSAGWAMPTKFGNGAKYRTLRFLKKNART